MEIPFNKEMMTTNSIVVSREWEEYDYSFNILTKKEIKQLKEKLGDK